MAKQHPPPPATREEIAQMAKRAGLDLSPQHFDALCDAWAKVATLAARIPRARPRADEPAHTFISRRVKRDDD